MFIDTSPKISFLKRTILYLLKPVTLIHAFLIFLFLKTDRNCIKPNVSLSGKKNNAISKPFDIATLKKIGRKHNNATINDVVLSLLSTSVQEYMHSKSDF